MPVSKPQAKRKEAPVNDRCGAPWVVAEALKQLTGEGFSRQAGKEWHNLKGTLDSSRTQERPAVDLPGWRQLHKRPPGPFAASAGKPCAPPPAATTALHLQLQEQRGPQVTG